MLVKKDIARHLDFFRSNLKYFYLTAVLLLAVTSSVEYNVARASNREEFEMINLSIGQVGILDSINGSQRYGIEYRFKSIFSPYDFDIIPAVGAAMADNNAHFIYLDLKHDFYLSEQWILIPGFGLGLFKDSKEINLGSDLEFRSGLELSYQFHNRYRAGIALFHLSNGGISSLNPGTEVMVFSFSIPIHGN